MIRSTNTLQKNIKILQKKQENISSNIANVNTYGYKEQSIHQSTKKSIPMFNFQNGPELNQKNDFGEFVFSNQLDGRYHNMKNGGVRQTNNSTDFSIQGDGFFNIRLANGQIGYTKNGNFTTNQNGDLTTQEGYPVLSKNGTVIKSNELNREPAFAITKFNDTNRLVSLGQTIFKSTEAGQVDNESRVSAKSLEQSNVNVADQMVELIEVSRQFESNQKVLHATDDTLRRATNELGKV